MVTKTKKIVKKKTSRTRTQKYLPKIFIQIASYRDPELIPTIKDCIQNAKYPERLVFCIAWQHAMEDTWDNLDEFRNDTRFKIIDIPHTETKGACWARSLIQRMYNNEEYTLQLDSHHRFVKHWDQECIKMITDLQTNGHEKPLLTTYLTSYNPNNDPAERAQTPWKMIFDRFIPEGAIFFLPVDIDNHKELELPVPARFYSAHFAFTLGQFCKEVPHDPEYYFHGEEISIAVRAFTRGYDLFHPHKLIAWHEYTRNGRSKHWEDDSKWGEKNAKCHLRNRKLFGMDGEINDLDMGRYGFGNVRTLEDYELYAGINFKKRAIQQYTLDNKLPPNPVYVNQEDLEKSWMCIFKHCVDVSYNEVPETDYDFWVLSFEDKDGKELFRKDVTKEEIDYFMRKTESYIKIWRQFHTEVKPYKYILWPHSISKGWCERMERVLP